MLKVFAERLAGMEGSEDLRKPESADREVAENAYQRALREFAANVPTRLLRVVDGRRVIASINVAEIGTTLPQQVVLTNRVPNEAMKPRASAAEHDGRSATDAARAGRELLFRLPLPDRGRLSKTLYLEAKFLSGPVGSSRFAGQAGMLSIVLVVLGALFLVYRCLREQLRGASRIADRLQTHRDRIEEDIASLHIEDAWDMVTIAWNEVVDLIQHLRADVGRAEANKELLRALHQSSSSALADALHAIPDGIVYIRDEVHLEYLNSTACHLFGWDPQEAKRTLLPEAQSVGIGAKVLDLIRDALQPGGTFEARISVLEAEDEELPVGNTSPGDSVHTRPDSRARSSYRVWVLPLQQTRHKGQCIVVIRDASQQIRAERSREEFIAQVTHELRTPLTNIRAYAETLASGKFDDPKTITECYNVITKETRRLSRLIEDILSVSQLEVGTIDLNVDDVDLRTLLGEGVRDVRGLADEKNIDLQLVLPAKLEPIRADRDKLALVINNLLGNAIKYTPPEGNIVVGCRLTETAVALTFKDNGIGIDSADHARVFEKFQRGSCPEVQKEIGTGVGLYTAGQIVRQHGGDIELISEKGQGSTFIVRLPRCASRATAMSHKEM